MNYQAPATAEEAVSMLVGAGGEGHILAGGTDLLVQLRSGYVSPGLVVDVKRIDEMTEIDATGTGFRIGAAVSAVALGEHDALRAAWPGVVEAARLIGSEQIQSRASLGGNLCNGSPAADTVPALIAADAVCNIVGPDGRRTAPVGSIVNGPGQTSLDTGEIVVSFDLPVRPDRSADAYLRFIPRTEMDIAVVGVGVSVTLDADGTCTDARVGLGAVAPTALLVADAAAALIGSNGDDAALEQAANAARAACDPIDDKRGTVDYRIRVAGVLTQRAAKIAFDRAGAK